MGESVQAVKVRVDVENRELFVDGVKQNVDDFDSTVSFVLEQSEKGNVEVEAV